MNSIFYAFNKHIQLLAEKLMEGTDIDPKGLFDFLVKPPSQDENSQSNPANWIKTKIPTSTDDPMFDIDSMIKIDFYYLRKSLTLLKELL